MKEKCPKCSAIFIQWNGGYFHCLSIDCQHKWTKWPNGPQTYDELDNPHLIASLPHRSSIPFVDQ